MSYYAHHTSELSEAGIREGEIGLYTGVTANRKKNELTPNTIRKNAYVYLWKDGTTVELDSEFHTNKDRSCTMTIPAGDAPYRFLWEGKTGYLRQVSGPANPIVVANLETVPLRVDTFLGKFTVYTGMLRLDEHAPRRQKKKVLLTLSPDEDQPLISAGLWDGSRWQPLNISRVPAPDAGPRWADRFSAGSGGEPYWVIRDGSAVVQCLTSSYNREFHVLDSPEPEPDYEIFISANKYDFLTLRFDATDYRNGLVVPRRRNLEFLSDIYDLKRIRESTDCEMLQQCSVSRCALEADAAFQGTEPPLPQIFEDFPE